MRRAHGLPAGSENVPMVTQSLQDKQETHICCKRLRIGNKMNWEGEGRKKWQPGKRFGFRLRYHNLQEKGGVDVNR